MDKERLELYTDYLISNFGLATATGLSGLLDGQISHDQVTRFLAERDYTSKDLWLEVKGVVRQPLRIHRDMPLDARYFLARVIPFFFCRVRVFHALRIHDAKARLVVPPMRGALCGHLILLMPAPAGLACLPTASRSIAGNICRPDPTSENRAARPATGTPPSTRTGSRTTPRTNPPASGASFSGHTPASA